MLQMWQRKRRSYCLSSLLQADELPVATAYGAGPSDPGCHSHAALPTQPSPSFAFDAAFEALFSYGVGQQEYTRLYGTAPHGEWQLKAAPFSPAVLMLADEKLGVIGMSRHESEVY